MRIPDYPINLQNEVQIVRKTEYGGYVIRYKKSKDNYGLLWLPDALENYCPMDSKAGEAIELVRKYVHSLLVPK
jgi:hypothetical protein